MVKWEIRLAPDDAQPVRVIEAEELLLDDDKRAAIFFTQGEAVAVIYLKPGITITQSPAERDNL